MADQPNIALLGANDPLGTAVIEVIEERGIEVGTLFALTLGEADGCITWQETEVPLESAQSFDWSQVEMLIVASRAPAAAKVAKAAAKAGTLVWGVSDIPDDLLKGEKRVPNAAAIALQKALTPINQQAGLTEIFASVMLPVAMVGVAGIEELAGQSRALFAMESHDPEVLPMPIAFNMVPHAQQLTADGSSTLEAFAAEDLRKLLDLADASVMISATWTPLFHGFAANLHGRAKKSLNLDELRATLSKAENITVMDEPLPAGVATPSTDAHGTESVFVSRLRVDAHNPSGFSLWLVFDGLRMEAAQIVAVLENLIEKNKNSVLT